MAEKIGLVGYDCEDITLYLAYSLKELGKSVAIEDRTEHGIMLRMLDAETNIRNGEGTKVDFQEIMVTNSILHKEEFDYVFIIFGYRLLHPKLYECEKLILVTDNLPAHASLLSELEKWERRQILLVRNYIESKYDIDYLSLVSGQKTEEIICIPWEEKDIRIRSSLGNAETIRLHRLSTDMRVAVKRITEFVLSDSQQGLADNGSARKKVWEKWLHFGRR